MIVLVFGLPGTGKTYFSKHLAKEIEAKHLNTDMIREKLNKKGDYSERAKQQVYETLFQETLKTVNGGWSVIVDGTFHLAKRRRQLVKLANETNTKIFFIEMKASEKTIVGRLKQHRDFSEADLKVYRQIEQQFEPETENRLGVMVRCGKGETNDSENETIPV